MDIVLSLIAILVAAAIAGVVAYRYGLNRDRAEAASQLKAAKDDAARLLEDEQTKHR
jgi:hypothetical protein